uniref:Uncharacterized protein n=1 Tax=viral metagenome TaxID=1070528 RepID=A0A6H1ZYU3_9ZZZZ
MYSKTITEIEQAANSITVKLGAKGDYGWEIKLFFVEGEEVHCVKVLGEIDGLLRKSFGSDRVE